MEIVMELNLLPEYRTRIYISTAGYICLEQQEAIDDRLPVMISLSQAKIFLEALPEFIEASEIAVAELNEVDDEQED